MKRELDFPLNSTSVQRSIFVQKFVSCTYFDAWTTVHNSLATSKEKFWFAGGALNEWKFEDWLVRWLDAYKSTDTPAVMLRCWLDKCEDIDGSLRADFEVLNLFGSNDLRGFILKSKHSEGETYVRAILITYQISFHTLFIDILWILFQLSPRSVSSP